MRMVRHESSGKYGGHDVFYETLQLSRAPHPPCPGHDISAGASRYNNSYTYKSLSESLIPPFYRFISPSCDDREYHRMIPRVLVLYHFQHRVRVSDITRQSRGPITPGMAGEGGGGCAGHQAMEERTLQTAQMLNYITISIFSNTNTRTKLNVGTLGMDGEERIIVVD